MITEPSRSESRSRYSDSSERLPTHADSIDVDDVHDESVSKVISPDESSTTETEDDRTQIVDRLKSVIDEMPGHAERGIITGACQLSDEVGPARG